MVQRFWPVIIGLYHENFDMFLQFVQSSFGINIKWDGRNTAQIEIPQLYYNKTCGLCGTLDDDASNDFMTSDGVLVS